LAWFARTRLSESEQEAKDKSASDTPRESPAETTPELRVQHSFTYNDEDSNSDGSAARFVMQPTQINDSFAAKFQCSSIHSLSVSVSPQPAVRRYYRLAQKSLDIPHTQY